MINIRFYYGYARGGQQVQSFESIEKALEELNKDGFEMIKKDEGYYHYHNWNESTFVPAKIEK